MSQKNFETALRKLEKIVEELESGDLALETALKKFEEGMQLSRFCADKLDETEKRITLLMKDHTGNTTERPYSPDTGDGTDNNGV